MFTVIVCTYNRKDFLKICLESVLNDILVTSPSCEVLVVDNNSNDGTEVYVKHLMEKHSCVKYVFEREQGLSKARNAGLKSASFEYCVFLDDDAFVSKGWLGSIVKEIKRNEFDVFGGVYYPWYKEGKRRFFSDEYASNIRWLKPLQRRLLLEETLSGGNFCLKKSSALKVGGFSESLGMNGKVMSYGEETDMQIRLRNAGEKLGLNPEMTIFHYTPKKKQSLRWLVKRAVAEGRDDSKFRGSLSLFFWFKSFVILTIFPFLFMYRFLVAKETFTYSVLSCVHSFFYNVSRALNG